MKKRKKKRKGPEVVQSQVDQEVISKTSGSHMKGLSLEESVADRVVLCSFPFPEHTGRGGISSCFSGT